MPSLTATPLGGVGTAAHLLAFYLRLALGPEGGASWGRSEAVVAAAQEKMEGLRRGRRLGCFLNSYHGSQ